RTGRAEHLGARRTEQRREDERRLQRHADPLADDRMRLACGVADAKDGGIAVVATAEANAGAKRPAGEPRPFARRRCERRSDAVALAPEHGLEHIAGALAG